MKDQHSHRFLGLRCYSVLLYSALPRSHWLLPCAVPRGGVAFRATSTSTWSYTIRCGGLSLTHFLPVLWLVRSWMQPDTWCPVPSLLPDGSRAAAPHSPLASVSKNCGGGPIAPRSGAEVPKCCLPRDGKGWASALAVRGPVRV